MIKSMNDLFLHGLKDIYYAEKQILKALLQMVKKVTSPELKQGLEAHLQETENQVRRLEEIFGMVGVPARGEKCPAMDGIIAEAKEVMGEMEGPDVCDAGILAAAQTVEHYEIARYGTLVSWAEQLSMNDAAELLQETLKEEQKADETLTGLAEKMVSHQDA